MEVFHLTSPEISCEHCKATIEREIGSMPGVDNVFVDVAKQRVTVAYEPQTVSEGTILTKLEEEGYPAQGA